MTGSRFEPRPPALEVDPLTRPSERSDRDKHILRKRDVDEVFNRHVGVCWLPSVNSTQIR